MARPRRSRRSLLIASSCIAFLLLPLAAIAQFSGALQLGDVSYSRAPAKTLRQPVNFSPKFFRGVGGVAFNAVAEGEGGIVVQGLRYEPSAADGDRLVITIAQGGGTRAVRGRIHDWAMIPIARFAADENGSAMTLFGRLDNELLEKQVLDRRGRVINYHPALDNTLLGLRMFHADILIIQENAVHLFKRDGRNILGNGESGHDPAQNAERFRRIVRWQQEQEQRGNKFQSYVVGDLQQRVAFSVRDGRLEFTGTPYWAAWKPKFDLPADRARLQALAVRHDQLVKSYNSQVNSYNGRRNTMSNAEAASAQQQMNSTEAELNGVIRQYEELNDVAQMPDYSRALSQQIRSLDGINPVVYRALSTTMHYRALFKHYQKRDAAGFAAFVKSIERVAVEPRVETPTIQN